LRAAILLRVGDGDGTGYGYERHNIQLVNDLMTSLTTPDATAAATVLRDKMIEVRDLFKPIANEKW
jgi:hypothetical protein